MGLDHNWEKNETVPLEAALHMIVEVMSRIEPILKN